MGKVPGKDGVSVEMWREAPIQLKLRIAQHFRAYLAGGLERPESWRWLMMTALAKQSGAQRLDDHRMIAASATLSKWLLRVVLKRIRACPRRDRGLLVHTVGFTARRSTASIIATVREACWASRSWKRPLVVVSLDIQTCFDCMKPELMVHAMWAAGLPGGLVAAVAREYTGLQAAARIRDSDWCGAFIFTWWQDWWGRNPRALELDVGVGVWGSGGRVEAGQGGFSLCRARR